MDQICIKNLEVFCNHGVFPEENKLGQKFKISAILYTDTREAGRTDCLEKSIHYGEVCHKIKEFMEGHTYQLIERAAEELAFYLLQNTPNLQALDLEIKKPWAPIGLPLEEVSVRIFRSWHKVYLSIGSNMGDKKAYLEFGKQRLEESPYCQVKKVSDYIQTEPYGVTDQDWFLNGALELDTLLTPEELLDLIHRIEEEAERKRERRWGPRTLDLDIIFYDDLVLDSEELVIPHMDMRNRSFVLEPLAQIAPRKRHPIFNKTVEELKGEKNNGFTAN